MPQAQIGGVEAALPENIAEGHQGENDIADAELRRRQHMGVKGHQKEIEKAR